MQPHTFIRHPEVLGAIADAANVHLAAMRRASKGDSPGIARHPSRLAEFTIGPRCARTRWLAPQDDGEGRTSWSRCIDHKKSTLKTYPRSLPRSYIRSVLSAEGVIMRRRVGGTGCGACALRLVTSRPGRLGQPSAPTTWGCLQWLDEGRMNGGGSRRDQGAEWPRPDPEARSRGAKSPQRCAERRRAWRYQARPPKGVDWI